MQLEAKQVARVDFKLEVGGARGRGGDHGPGARAADRDHDRGRGHLGQHRAVAAAQRTERRPAGAAAAGDRHLQPARLHEHRQHQHEPAVRERQPGADEQLHGRRPRRERDDRQPRGLPAEPRRPRGDQRRDQQLRGRRRERRGRAHQQRHQVGVERDPRERVRVLPQQRLRREHLGEQPVRRPAPGAEAAHLRGDARRAHPEGQAVLLRRLPGLAPGRSRAGSGERGAGVVASRRPVEPAAGHGRPGSADRPAVPEQPDPGRPHQPDRARDPGRHRELPAAEPERLRSHRELRGRHALPDPRPPGRPPPGLERLAERQALRALLVRDLRGPARPEPVPAHADDAQRPALLQRRLQLEPRAGAVRRQRGAGRLQPHHGHRRNLRLRWRRPGQRALRHRRGTAHRRPVLHHERARGVRRTQRAHGPRLDRDGFRHRGQDLPAEREADLVPRTPRLQVRRPVPALRPAALLRGQQRPAGVHRLQRQLLRLPVRGLPAGPGRGQGPRRRRPRRPLDAAAEPARALRAGRLQAAVEPHAQPGAALGLHLAARGAGRPPVELRPRHRPADPRVGRGARALRALLQGLRAASRDRVHREPAPGPARRLRHLPVHGRNGRQPAGCRSTRRSSSSRRSPTTARPEPAPWAAGSPIWCRARRRPAT